MRISLGIMRFMDKALPRLLKEIGQCNLCAEHLSEGVNPVLQAHHDARILIIGQAPGLQVHKTSVPWDDASGERLRGWLGLDKSQFYGDKVALVPMGFCYPGRGKSGDLPPRKECAETWHVKLLSQLPNVQITILIGQYSQNYYLPSKEKTLTATVKKFRAYLPEFLVLPHPSPRNNIWLAKNPWFEQDVLPSLQARVNKAIQ